MQHFLSRHALVPAIAVTALAPAIWGTTYLATSELLPPGRPLLAAVVLDPELALMSDC